MQDTVKCTALWAPLPEGAALKLAHHHEMVPKLQDRRYDLQVWVLLKVIPVVKAAWAPRLHVRYALPLDWPGVRDPQVCTNVVVALILQTRMVMELALAACPASLKARSHVGRIDIREVNAWHVTA